jgi:hypothetical protein
MSAPVLFGLSGVLQAFQKGPNLGIRPVRIPDHLAPDIPLAVDDVRLRPTIGPIQLRHPLVRIAHRVDANVIPRKKPAIGARVRIDAHRDNRDIRPVAVQLLQRRRLLDARWTLAPPQVQQNHLAPIVRKMNSVLAVAHRKVGSKPVGVGWYTPAIAAARKRQHHQRPQGNESSQPHLLIIRSDGY